MTPGWTIVIKSISSQRFSPSVSRIAIEKERERKTERERERERDEGRKGCRQGTNDADTLMKPHSH